ncbi:hypothetical protein Plhal710r2_c050g0156191 [Plasmopara halstedii]
MRTGLPTVQDHHKDLVSSKNCNSSSDTRAWRQSLSLFRRDKGKSCAFAPTDWTRKNAHTSTIRPTASTFALSWTCKPGELRKLYHTQLPCINSDSSEYNSGSSDLDSLNMEDQLSTFVEYNAADVDSLDITPSQDFDGDCPDIASSQVSQSLQTCSWKDVTDVNQFQEEASEVFDDIIYEPPPDPEFCRGSAIKERRDAETAHSMHPMVNNTSEKLAFVCDDSESSLSDGFDVALNLTSKRKANSDRFDDIGANKTPEAKWRQRRSIKRDSSFVDTANSCSGNQRLSMMASPHPATTSEVEKAAADGVIELEDYSFDSNDDSKDGLKRARNACNSILMQSGAVPAVSGKVPVSSSPVPSTALYSDASQPRFVRKRRKLGQLTLDAFLRQND